MTARRAPKAAHDSFTEIATLRIELNYSDPPIWRLVEVPTSITLKVLHDIVQVTMGWLDYHLWEFRIDGTTHGPPMDEDWGTSRANQPIEPACVTSSRRAPRSSTIPTTSAIAGNTSSPSATCAPAIPPQAIPGSSTASATAHRKTAAAFPGSKKCSKPAPMHPIPTTPTSANG